jgi:hypothetical protein
MRYLLLALVAAGLAGCTPYDSGWLAGDMGGPGYRAPPAYGYSSGYAPNGGYYGGSGYAANGGYYGGSGYGYGGYYANQPSYNSTGNCGTPYEWRPCTR